MRVSFITPPTIIDKRLQSLGVLEALN
jgi:hypothetical protein